MRSDSNIGHYDLHDRLFLNSRDRRCRFYRLHDPTSDKSSWLRCGSVVAAAFCCRLAFWISNWTQKWFAVIFVLLCSDRSRCASDRSPWSYFLRKISIRDFAQEFHSGFSLWILAQLAVLGDIFLRRIARQEFSPQIAWAFVWFLSRCDFFARY